MTCHSHFHTNCFLFSSKLSTAWFREPFLAIHSFIIAGLDHTMFVIIIPRRGMFADGIWTFHYGKGWWRRGKGSEENRNIIMQIATNQRIIMRKVSNWQERRPIKRSDCHVKTFTRVGWVDGGRKESGRKYVCLILYFMEFVWYWVLTKKTIKLISIARHKQETANT